MNSKEQMWHILKCNDPTPHTVRDWIDDCFVNRTDKLSDWIDVESDQTLFSIKYKNCKFFKIYVYYETNIGTTMCVIKFKEDSYSQKIKQSYVLDGIDNYVIYCEDMDKLTFLDEFEHIYDEFNKYCKRVEYM